MQLPWLISQFLVKLSEITHKISRGFFFFGGGGLIATDNNIYLFIYLFIIINSSDFIVLGTKSGMQYKL